MLSMGLRDFKFRPFITGFFATAVSGGVFTFILKLILSLPLNVWTHAMLPVVMAVAALNGVITQALFAPVQKLFFMQEGKKHE